MHELLKGGGSQRRGQCQNSNDNKSDAVHSRKRMECECWLQDRQLIPENSTALSRRVSLSRLALGVAVNRRLTCVLIRRNGRCAAQISFACRAKSKGRCRQSQSPQATKAIRVSRDLHNARRPLR